MGIDLGKEINVKIMFSGCNVVDIVTFHDNFVKNRINVFLLNLYDFEKSNAKKKNTTFTFFQQDLAFLQPKRMPKYIKKWLSVDRCDREAKFEYLNAI